MRNLAICGRRIPTLLPHADSIATVAIDGVSVVCGLLDTEDRDFDPRLDENARRVLVRVRRFSCNFRDKKLILHAAQRLPDSRFLVIGSEFVGDVMAVGPEVRRVRPGDRVIGDNSYPHVGPGDAPAAAHGGIPTNAASAEFLVLHEEKVIAVPAGMPDDAAAAFSVGAQTAFSMVTKLMPRRGEHILVTAGASNTSLFAIEALRLHDVAVYVTTTSARQVERLRARGVRDVFVVDGGLPLEQCEAFLTRTREIGGFTGVIDPFFDAHLLKLLPFLRNGARYVSCGFHDQRRVDPGAATPAIGDYRAALCAAIVKNIAFIGNCVGLRPDLEHALAAYEQGGVRVPVDSVYCGNRAGEFLARTFASNERFGKVVYAYQ